MDQFLDHLDNLLSTLSSLPCQAYIFLDSNINALKFNPANPEHFFSIIHENLFSMCIRKATRIQNGVGSLIDYILLNMNPMK